MAVFWQNYKNPKDIAFANTRQFVTLIDTLGAGDAFGSCFVASLAQGKSVPDALRAGIVNSASGIQQLGAKPGLLEGKALAKAVKALPSDALKKY